MKDGVKFRSALRAACDPPITQPLAGRERPDNRLSSSARAAGVAQPAAAAKTLHRAGLTSAHAATRALLNRRGTLDTPAAEATAGRRAAPVNRLKLYCPAVLVIFRPLDGTSDNA